MAKRTRYDSRPTGRRPAANRLVRRDPLKPRPTSAEATPIAPVILDPIDDLTSESGAPATARGRGLSQAEIDRAAQLEAEMTGREKAIVAATRSRAQVLEGGHAAVDVNAPLSVRASKEYAYVARDVRRIVLTGGLMVALLAIFDVLINGLQVVKL